MVIRQAARGLIQEELLMQISEDKFILYAVTDRRWLNGRSLAEAVEQAVKGGAGIVQLREKNLSDEAFLQEAIELKAVCSQYKVPLIINDNVEVMLKSDADGIHVGQSDLDAADVRRKIGPDKILGVSAHNIAEARLAVKHGADYLGVGAAFATDSKTDVNVVPHSVYKEICSETAIPVVAIGGINKDNIAELKGSGISGAAVISAIFAADDIEAAARELRRRIAVCTH